MTGHEQRHPVAQAAHAIQVAGHVQLPGAPALRTKVLGVLIVILMILVALLACGGVVFAAAAFMTGVRLTIATLIGLITVLGLLTVVFLCLVSTKRRQARYKQAEGLPVRLEARGLTLRGVGPIPWSDFEPARYTMVRSSSDNAYERRALMPLAPSGMTTVNQRLPHELRTLLSPRYGVLGNRHHRWIWVPGVAGISEPDVMELINWTRALFLSGTCSSRVG